MKNQRSWIELVMVPQILGYNIVSILLGKTWKWNVAIEWGKMNRGCWIINWQRKKKFSKVVSFQQNNAISFGGGRREIQWLPSPTTFFHSCIIEIFSSWKHTHLQERRQTKAHKNLFRTNIIILNSITTTNI